MFICSTKMGGNVYRDLQFIIIVIQFKGNEVSCGAMVCVLHCCVIYFFQSTIYAGRSPDVVNTLGIHFSPSVAVFFPVYMMFPYSVTMLLITVLSYTGTAFIFYLIARKYLEPGKSFCVACCYLLHPAVFFCHR